jgi:hypothetical protein
MGLPFSGVLRNPQSKATGNPTNLIGFTVSPPAHHTQPAALGLDDVGFHHTFYAGHKQQARSPWGSRVVGGFFFKAA